MPNKVRVDEQRYEVTVLEQDWHYSPNNFISCDNSEWHSSLDLIVLTALYLCRSVLIAKWPSCLQPWNAGVLVCATTSHDWRHPLLTSNDHYTNILSLFPFPAAPMQCSRVSWKERRPKYLFSFIKLSLSSHYRYTPVLHIETLLIIFGTRRVMLISRNFVGPEESL